MNFIIGKKIGMTQIFDEDGKVVPVTIVKAGPCSVTQLKKVNKDGYNAVQLAFGKLGKANLAKRGHIGKSEYGDRMKEFRVNKEEVEKVKKGSVIKVDEFKIGDIVRIFGDTKGKGFQGVVKRYNFGGDLKTHGRKHSLRKPGSIASKRLSKVAKGKKMAGHMGNSRQALFSAKIVKVENEKNLLFIKGGLPGKTGTILEIVAG